MRNGVFSCPVYPAICGIQREAIIIKNNVKATKKIDKIDVKNIS